MDDFWFSRSHLHKISALLPNNLLNLPFSAKSIKVLVKCIELPIVRLGTEKKNSYLYLNEKFASRTCYIYLNKCLALRQGAEHYL